MKDRDKRKRIAEYLKKHFVSIAMLLFVLLVIVLIYLNAEMISGFRELGYIGAFLIGLVANATILFPMPGLLLLFALSTVYNPVLVGIIGGAGGAIGEMSGYFLGYSGRGFAKSNPRIFTAERWIKKWGAGAIFVFSLVPFLPLDIAGITAGILRYPVWKFLLACFLGKALLYVAGGLASIWGWDFIRQIVG